MSQNGHWFSEPTLQAPLQKLEEALQEGEQAANGIIGTEGPLTISGALLLVEEALTRIIQKGDYPEGLEDQVHQILFQACATIAQLEQK